VEAMTRADLGNVEEGEEADHKEETATDKARRVCRAEERASPRAGWGAAAVRPLSGVCLWRALGGGVLGGGGGGGGWKRGAPRGGGRTRDCARLH
jgi:hypothetical protein